MSAVNASLHLSGSGALGLRYEISAEPGQVRWPVAMSAVFQDRLWRHTCFELFVARTDRAYREFNFSPSLAWAAYDFTDYRAGMQPCQFDEKPLCEVHGAVTTVRLPAPLVPFEPGAPLGIAAVIEERDGRLSYWALRHARLKPDFHDRAGFTANWPGTNKKWELRS